MSCSLNLYLHHDQLFISLYYYTECIIYMIIMKNNIILHYNNNNEALCITILCVTLNVYYVYMTLCMYNMYN